MKKTLGLLLIGSSLMFQGQLFSQTTTGAPGKSVPNQGVGPSQVERPPLGNPPEKLGPSKGPIKPEAPRPPPAPKYSIRPTFTQPGILSLRGSTFVGVDHLYNLSGTLPVVVEIVKSDSLTLSLTKEKVQGVVEQLFQADGLSTLIIPSDGAPLPFFNVLIMIIPSGDGVSAFCSGRVFEKVDIERVALPQGVYFQAITWEYQNMIFSSKEDSEKQITEAVKEIVQEFLTRYKYYKNITK